MRASFLALLMVPAAAQAASVSTALYGTAKNGRKIEQVTLASDSGMVVKVIGLGATVTEMIVPDRYGRKANVVLGYGGFADYEAHIRRNYFGATVGRYAGRIAGARFAIGGREYRLQPNDGANALHGGAAPGLESKIWSLRTFREGKTVAASFQYLSPDGEQGFPGALDVTITYRLLPSNILRIDYAARATEATMLNLTNHSYFNLAGAGSGSVTGQTLRIAAARYVETDQNGIPTGRFRPVAGTPLDFRTPRAIGERIDARTPPMGARGGYNHAWLLDKRPGALALAAVLDDPGSGRRLTVSTTEPSLQAYTGDYFSGEDVGAQGRIYRPRDGIALEAQHLSDSPNHPAFPTTLLRPGDVYRATTIWRFSVDR